MNDYSPIDLDKVRDDVAGFTYIKESKDDIRNEEIVFNPLIIRQKIRYTKEAMDLLKKDINVSFDGVENICDILDKADKDMILNPIELCRVVVFHNHIARIKAIFDKIDDELELKDFSDSFKVDRNLEKEIVRAIDNSGNIKETASDKLFEIISSIQRNDKALHNAAYSFIAKHGASLQESSIFFRNERMTFLIRNSDKNKFNGMSYGTSASGQATYVEPGQFIEMNNRKLSLVQDREEEVKRILKRLSYLVSSCSDIYRFDFDSVRKLSAIFAKAKYGVERLGVCGELSNDRELELKAIIHPLIPSSKAVSNTYTLKAPYQGIVISGTNTGGKTVGLKIIGLSVLMTYLGIPLLCEEAKVPFYSDVYVDIDDNQSVISSLSTFSAHITNINNILNNSSSSSLILIDELISGTDPKEAQAISLAILERILDIGAAFVITTHYDDIKNFAYDNSKILLSAVGFDLDKLQPTYKYSENTAGASNAIDIAERYLDDRSLIARSRELVRENRSKQDELLEKLARDIDETEKKTAELNVELEAAKKKEEELSSKILSFENEKDKLRDKYLSELNEYIENLKEEALAEVAKMLETKDQTVVKKIEKIQPKPVKQEKKDVHFEVGDSVKVGGGDQIGTIDMISGNQVTVIVRGLSIRTKLSNLTKMPKASTKKERRGEKKIIRAVPKEINLVGERVEDGLILLESFLDNAFGAGAISVKVIHGIGTGQLRGAIRNKLKHLSFVKEFHDGDYYDGGSAVTIVEFKK